MSNNIILDPTAPSGAGAQRPWKALDTLKGKTVAFTDNAKPKFNHLAQDLGELLVEHHGVVKVIHHRKRAASVPALESVYAYVQANVDLVITDPGD